MWAGASCGQDEDRLLQGHQSQEGPPGDPFCISGLSVSAPECEVAERTLRHVVLAGSESESLAGHPSCDSALVPPDPKRQGTGRLGADVQPTHSRLDQL